MKQTYGVPYQGSKNRIAKDIIELLPSGHRFVDLFAGGCAMTHAAYLSGKYKRLLCNDKYPIPGIDLFKLAVAGEFDDPKYAIIPSYDEFYERRYIDPWMIAIYGFNDKPNYFAGKDGKTMKLIRRFGITNLVGLSEHGAKVQLNQLRRLQRLRGAVDLSKIQFTTKDYTEYEWREGDVVYCDPPYQNTKPYEHTNGFNHDAFYEWVRTRDYPVYFSEFSAPNDFVSLFEIQRSKMHNVHGYANKTTGIEKLYIHKKFKEEQ